MSNRVGFGSWEAICLLVNTVFVQGILYYPKDVSGLGGSAGWMIPVVITLIALIYFAIVAGFYRNTGSLDLLEISERSAGRVFKIIIGLLAALFLMFLEASLLGVFSHTLKIISLDKSPLPYIMTLFLLGMAAAAYYGIEAVARISAFIVPICITGFILITIGVFPKFNTDNLFPIYGNGINSIINGSAQSLWVFSPLLIFFFMVPFFKNRNINRVGYLSILLSGLVLIWSTLSFLLTFPYDMAVEKKVPVFQMARLIEVGNYIQRVESIFVLVFSLSTILYIGALFAFITHIIAKTLDLDRPQPIIMPTAVIIYCLALIRKRFLLNLLGSEIINFLWLFGLLLPLIVLITGSIKKVGSENEGGKEYE
ncbi:MAG TPA: GerAB/ArcD/ProY family transporter [Ruminiclostridium sp.]|nr:GerAB/ArcD/ProY family transporter [Ruminiclostridium sp.]